MGLKRTDLEKGDDGSELMLRVAKSPPIITQYEKLHFDRTLAINM